MHTRNSTCNTHTQLAVDILSITALCTRTHACSLCSHPFAKTKQSLRKNNRAPALSADRATQLPHTPQGAHSSHAVYSWCHVTPATPRARNILCNSTVMASLSHPLLPSPLSLAAAALPLLPSWAPAVPSSLSVTPLVGGMSNQMFILSHPDDRRVVARLLSPTLDAVIDRATEECIVQHLGQHSLTPRVIGSTTLHGTSLRLEVFIPGDTLPAATLRRDPSVVAAVAQRLRDVHTHIPPALSTQGYQFTALLTRFLAALAPHRADPPPELHTLLVGPAGGWEAAVAWLAGLLERGDAGPPVLVHGDSQAGNWLVDPGVGGGLTLIDLEYARVCARGFDAGNLMCEFGYTYELDSPGFSVGTHRYPPLAWQARLLSAYADEPPPTVEEEEGDTWARTTTSPAGLRALRLSPACTRLAEEARTGLLMSHACWALWSGVMAAGVTGALGHSNFNYVEYGKDRLEQFSALQAQWKADRQ